MAIADSITQHPRFTRWLQKRGPLKPPFTLVYRQIYILPTRFGVIFGVLLLAMFLGALNYNNNAALFLSFLLAGTAQFSTFRTWRNLAGLHIGTVNAETVHAGEAVDLQINLRDTQHIKRPILEIDSGKSGLLQYDLDPDMNINAITQIPSTQRGWLECPRLRLSTVYPLGLFRAWAYIQPHKKCLVYPALPQSLPAMPLPKAGVGNKRQSHDPDADFAGLRAFRDGDHQKDIAWKASARNTQLISRDDPPVAFTEYLFRLDDAIDSSIEKRISILTGWLLKAETLQAHYGIALPGVEIAPAKGAAHLHHCLKALALWRA